MDGTVLVKTEVSFLVILVLFYTTYFPMSLTRLFVYLPCQVNLVLNKAFQLPIEKKLATGMVT